VNNLILVPFLIGPPDNANNSVVPDQAQHALSSGMGKLNATWASKFEQWMSVTSATAKLFLRGAKESTDAFPPLKSAVGGLCFIVDSFEVWQLHSIHHLQYLQVS